MEAQDIQLIERARKAAIEVLLHNSQGTVANLPRTAGWGYPEPYTRDLLISSLGIAASGNKELLSSIQNVMQTLVDNQSDDGQIPSLVNDKNNKGSSDTTPLFLLAVGILRQVFKDINYLETAVKKASVWMEYQCPTSYFLIAQQPTSDWRDEQWVLGFGLFVNATTYAGYLLLDQKEMAENLGTAICRWTYSSDTSHSCDHEGLAIKDLPYFALWSYKVYSSNRFDLLGNSLSILSGLATAQQANAMVDWIENECSKMRSNNLLAMDVTPNFFPFIQRDDPDWLPRYKMYNKPGDYHNGGIWPFISGFYIAALVASKQYDLAETKLISLTHLIKKGRDENLEYGFNEWYKAQTGKPMGQDWQTWSASSYLYASECVLKKRALFFEILKTNS